MEKITMNDIARMAGVAKSTVSRYFNGGYVKEETREKIRTIIQEYNYEPSAAAKTLRSYETRTIGIVAPTLNSVTTGRLLTSVNDYLMEHGYSVLIQSTNHDPARELACLEYLISLRVDGIILIATNILEAHQKLVETAPIPILIVAQHFKNAPSIIYDDWRAGKDVGKLAAQTGHQHVLYIGVGERDEAVGLQRKKGVLEGLAENGVDQVDIIESDFLFQNARIPVREYLEKNTPDLIIAATDNLALAAFKELCMAGRKVPEEVSLIGFGHYEAGQLITPSLCSVCFDYGLAGQIAGSTILAMIAKLPVSTTQVIGYTIELGQSLANRRLHKEKMDRIPE